MQLQTCRHCLTCRYRHANIHTDTDKDMQTNKYREGMQRRTQIQKHKCRHRHIVDDTLVWYDMIWCASQCGQNDDWDCLSNSFWIWLQSPESFGVFILPPDPLSIVVNTSWLVRVRLCGGLRWHTCMHAILNTFAKHFKYLRRKHMPNEILTLIYQFHDPPSFFPARHIYIMNGDYICTKSPAKPVENVYF